jgi:hypothetical protein
MIPKVALLNNTHTMDLQPKEMIPQLFLYLKFGFYDEMNPQGFNLFKKNTTNSSPLN